jgi:homoserine kinase
LLDAGALATCWSGAGPALLAICDRDRAAAVRDGGQQLLDRAGVAGTALALDADTTGLVVELL